MTTAPLWTLTENLLAAKARYAERDAARTAARAVVEAIDKECRVAWDEMNMSTRALSEAIEKEANRRVQEARPGKAVTA